jgi:hypothetical protein
MSIKSINVQFSEEELTRIQKDKGTTSWRDFILSFVREPQKSDEETLFEENKRRSEIAAEAFRKRVEEEQKAQRELTYREQVRKYQEALDKGMSIDDARKEAGLDAQKND